MREDLRKPAVETPVNEASSEVIDWRKVRGEVLRDIFRSEVLKQKTQRLAQELRALWRDKKG